MQTEKIFILRVYLDGSHMIDLYSLEKKVLENTIKFFEKLVKPGHMTFKTVMEGLINTNEDMAKKLIEGYNEFQEMIKTK